MKSRTPVADVSGKHHSKGRRLHPGRPQVTPTIRKTLQKGIALQSQGKFREAEHCYQLVLRDNPNRPEAFNLLGLLALEANKPDASIMFLHKAVKASPKDPKYRNNLANSYILDEQPEKALIHLRKALSANPRLIESLMNMARAYRGLGKGEEAVRMYQRVLAFQSDFLPAKTGLGDVLLDLGRMDEAADIFRETLSEAPNTVRAITGLADARRFSLQDSDINLIENLLASDKPNNTARAAIHYAAGKIRSDMKQYNEAFAHYAKAKEVAGSTFDITAYRIFVDRMDKLFTSAFFDTKTDFGNGSERPVFIVGMPRSGTTLTEQILACHPQITGAGELVEIEKIARLITKSAPRGSDRYFAYIEDLRAEDANKYCKHYLSVLNRCSRTASRVIDKTPHNFEALGLIAVLFPNARVIHCRRDPMDTCMSCFTHNFNEAHAYTTELETLGLYYREYDRLMAHWKEVLPVRMIGLQYENLVADTAAGTRRLLDFLGLPWDEACLKFHESERIVRTPSRWQVRQPIYTTSVQRWRRYDEHLGPLKKALGDLFVED